MAAPYIYSKATILNAIQEIFAATPLDDALCCRSYSEGMQFANVGSNERYTRHQQIVISGNEAVDIRWKNRCAFTVTFYRRLGTGLVACDSKDLTAGATPRLLSRLRRHLHANTQYSGHIYD